MNEKLVSLQIPSDATSIISVTPNEGFRMKSFCDEEKVPFKNQAKELEFKLRFSKNIGFPIEITVSFPGKYFALTEQLPFPFKQ